MKAVLYTGDEVIALDGMKVHAPALRVGCSATGDGTQPRLSRGLVSDRLSFILRPKRLNLLGGHRSVLDAQLPCEAARLSNRLGAGVLFLEFHRLNVPLEIDGPVDLTLEIEIRLERPQDGVTDDRQPQGAPRNASQLGIRHSLEQMNRMGSCSYLKPVLAGSRGVPVRNRRVTRNVRFENQVCNTVRGGGAFRISEYVERSISRSPSWPLPLKGEFPVSPHRGDLAAPIPGITRGAIISISAPCLDNPFASWTFRIRIKVNGERNLVLQPPLDARQRALETKPRQPGVHTWAGFF